MDEEPTFFVLDVQEAHIGEEISFEYSLVQIPFDKIEGVMNMWERVEAEREKLLDLREDEHQNFGSGVHDEISQLEIKVGGLESQINDYLGRNAISYLSVVERNPIATFERGDGIGKGAIDKMIDKKVLEIAQEKIHLV